VQFWKQRRRNSFISLSITTKDLKFPTQAVCPGTVLEVLFLGVGIRQTTQVKSNCVYKVSTKILPWPNYKPSHPENSQHIFLTAKSVLNKFALGKWSRLRGLGVKVSRNIFWSNRRMIKMYSKGLHTLYCSRNIRVIRYRRMCWSEYLRRVMEMMNVSKIWREETTWEMCA
jgi:hypothetical protein